jgi:hypothetical protein
MGQALDLNLDSFEVNTGVKDAAFAKPAAK